MTISKLGQENSLLLEESTHKKSVLEDLEVAEDDDWSNSTSTHIREDLFRYLLLNIYLF